jgi:hypothetical protein
MIPATSTVNRLMDDTGMDRLQAIRHLQSREALQRRLPEFRQREGLRHAK